MSKDNPKSFNPINEVARVFVPAMVGTTIGWPLWKAQTLYQSLSKAEIRSLFEPKALQKSFSFSTARNFCFKGLGGVLTGKLIVLPLQMLPGQVAEKIYPKENQSLSFQIGLRLFSGLLCAPFFNIIERCTLESSLHNLGFVPSIQKMWAKDGLKGLAHGSLPTGIREGKFLLSTFIAQPHLINVFRVFINDTAASLAGGFSASLLSIALSQPWDSTMRKMHAQPMQYRMRSALLAVMKEKGIKGLYTGSFLKSLRLAILMICILKGNTYFQQKPSIPKSKLSDNTTGTAFFGASLAAPPKEQARELCELLSE